MRIFTMICLAISAAVPLTLALAAGTLAPAAGLTGPAQTPAPAAAPVAPSLPQLAPSATMCETPTNACLLPGPTPAGAPCSCAEKEKTVTGVAK